MALTTKTNANIDAIAGAVPGPFGPLTRVTNMDTLGYVPNSDRPIRFTSAISSTPVDISYDDLVDVRSRDRILTQAHSLRNVNGEWEHALSVLRVAYQYSVSQTVPHLDSERRAIIDMIRTVRDFVAQPPNFENLNVSNDSPAGIVVAFTVTDADAGGAALAAAVVNTSIGGQWYLWDWGDGTFSTGHSPSNHTYATSGSKTVTLTVVGNTGSAKLAKVVVMA